MEIDLIRNDGSAGLEEYKRTGDIVADVKAIIESTRNSAYEAINAAIIRKNWLIGRRIVEEKQQGKQRATYGAQLISELSKSLTSELGSGYSPRNLRSYRSFYLTFSEEEIWQTCLPNLTWSHYNALLRVDEKKAREWYLKKTVREAWSVKTLERSEGDNPTLSIVLCSDTNEDIAKYSVLNGSKQLFASKYKLYLPSEDELRREIEVQKSFFMQQQKDRKEGEEDE